jgi:hypothetical protein
VSKNRNFSITSGKRIGRLVESYHADRLAGDP